MCPEVSKEWVRLQCAILSQVPRNGDRDKQRGPVKGLRPPAGMITAVSDDSPASYLKKWKV